ncbi:MAG: DedA family protein [Euzebya sp.]
MTGTEQLTGIVGWTAGLVGFEASRGSMSIVAAIIAATLGSVIGAFALYGLGRWLGLRRIAGLWGRMPLTEDDDIDRAVGWFEAHGVITADAIHSRATIATAQPGASSPVAANGKTPMPNWTATPCHLMMASTSLADGGRTGVEEG